MTSWLGEVVRGLAVAVALLVVVHAPATAQSPRQVPADPGGVTQRFDVATKRLASALKALEASSAALASGDLQSAMSKVDEVSGDLAAAQAALEELSEIAAQLAQLFSGFNPFGLFDGVIARLEAIRADLELRAQQIQLFRTGELRTLEEAVTQAELIGELLAERFEREEEALPETGK